MTPNLARFRSLLAGALLAPLFLAGGGALVATTSPSALADPPRHAPAHGWRRKHDDRDDDHDDDRDHDRDHRRYDGYTGDDWDRDYGVRSGHCNTDQILAAVGAVAGGVIGNRTASEGNRTVATIVGAIIGGVVGAKVGDAIDDRDRACIGHSLELVHTGRTVYWTNPRSGIGYLVRPTRDISDGCREFELVADRGGRKSSQTMQACRTRDGAWQYRR